MSWNCTFTEERLSDFLEGALSPEEAAAFSAHSAGCEHCAATIAQVSALVNGMHRTAFVEEPPFLVRKILAATLAPRKQERASTGLFGWLSGIWQPRFAMGVATVAASFVIVFHAAGPAATKTGMNPMNLWRAANRQAHLTYARSTRFVNDLRFVYEIQSRLAPEPSPISEPLPGPSGVPSSGPQPDEQQQSPSAPSEKSQKPPHSERHETRNEGEWALLADPVSSDTQIAIFNISSRSLL